MKELSHIMSIVAFASFLPICVFALRKHPSGYIYWLLLLCPLVVSIAFCLHRTLNSWHSDFVTSLWVSIATALTLFTLISVRSMDMRRLTILFLPYMALFAASAIMWSFLLGFDTVDAPMASTNSVWLLIHIVSSVLTYALITLAATSALAVYIREWALKAKRKSDYIDLLPSMADGERLQIRLMVMSEIILGAGLLSGVATQFMISGGWISLDHKILLSLAAFVVLGVLLFAHFKTGIRGQKAARVLLLCYLLVTMGFPGLKFVTDVLIGA